MLSIVQKILKEILEKTSQLEDADPLLYAEICDRRLCTKLVNHFHCKLCSGNVSFQRSYYILRHIKQVHLNQNHYVTHDSVVCLPSRCDILPLVSASRKANHYHCPKCIAIVKQKGHFLQHLKSHLIKRNKSLKEQELFSSPTEQKQSPKEKELSSRSTKTSEEPNIVKNKSSPQNRVLSNVALRVQCPECNVNMRKDSLPRHRKTKHCNIQEIKCICVDNEECICMVPKSQRGVKYPLHVQKSFYEKMLLK